MMAGHPDAGAQRATLAALVEAAIGGDGGLVKAMAGKSAQIQQDIPAAFEMVTLLSHYLATLPLQHCSLEHGALALAPGIMYDTAAGRVLALIDLQAGELALVAYWVSGGLRSELVKSMAGLLALPFSIEDQGGVPQLIPEWFAAFYVGSSEQHCVPILTLPSITQDARMGDWVDVAFLRMPLFGLPCASASAAVKHQLAS